jgi:hypothetical protein
MVRDPSLPTYLPAGRLAVRDDDYHAVILSLELEAKDPEPLEINANNQR